MQLCLTPRLEPLFQFDRWVAWQEMSTIDQLNASPATLASIDAEADVILAELYLRLIAPPVYSEEALALLIRISISEHLTFFQITYSGCESSEVSS